MKRQFAIAALAALASVAATAANAQEVTLKGITAFAEKTFNSRAFERFIEKVNSDGKGQDRKWKVEAGNENNKQDNDDIPVNQPAVKSKIHSVFDGRTSEIR